MSDSQINLDINRPLIDYCRNATNIDGDTFVGIKFEYIEDKHNLSINFPLGYKMSKDDELVREDIIQLISILQEYNDERSKIGKIMPESHLKTVRFPVRAYYIIMLDFLDNGYYQIQEEQYRRGTSGSVNWNRTIKQESPIPQENGFLYPQYRVKHHNETDKDLITEINKYCVFQSYLRMGWIYKLQLPQRPVRKRSNSFYKEYLTSFY